MDFLESARAEGIRLRSWAVGNHKTVRSPAMLPL